MGYNLKQNNFKQTMKSFAFTLFATTVLGSIRNNQVVNLSDLSQLNEAYTMEVG